MIETKRIIDFEDTEDVKKYLESYRAILCGDLPDKVLMSFVGVLYESRGEDNVVNRKTAIDYLGFTGFGREELERVAESDEDERLRKIALKWLSNREKMMISYLCINEETNRFGRADEIIHDPFMEGVVVSVIGKGHMNELSRVYLTRAQRLNLGFDLRIFKINFQGLSNNSDKIYLTYKGSESRAECSKTNSRIDCYRGCEIKISKSLANKLSLRVGSRVELSKLSKDERFYV
ncbi:MAG: hypothetical protein AABW75_03240 [Nanoarchaeota archaeon]